MANLGLKEMGKFLWEGREKSLPSWLSQFPKNFQIFLKPMIALSEFIWKMQRKPGIPFWASFPQKPVVKAIICGHWKTAESGNHQIIVENLSLRLKDF